MSAKIKAVLKRFLPKGKFSRAVSILAGGTAAAQLLLILASPLLTRLYSPEDFGLLAVYMSILAIIGVVSSLRYELAIPLPENKHDAANILILCVALLTLISMAVGVCVLFFGPIIVNVLDVQRIRDYLWLLPLGIFSTGAFSIFRYWNIRTKNFTGIAKTKLLQALTVLVIQLTAFKYGGSALLFGQLAGISAGAANLAKKSLTQREFRSVSLIGIKKMAVRYQRFPKYSSLASLVNVSGQQLPPIMFAIYFSVGSAGLYALAHRVLTLPSVLISGAIGNVFLSHASDAVRAKKINGLYFKLQSALIQLGLPPTMMLIIAGGDIFALVFGEDWREAGGFSQWLVMAAFASFIVSPLSQIFVVLEKQKTSLILQIILFFSRLLGIVIGIFYDNLYLTIVMFTIGSLFGYFLYIYVGGKYTDNPLRKTFHSLYKSCVFSFVACSPVLILSMYNNNSLLVVGLITSGLVILFRLRKVFRSSANLSL